MLGSAVRTRFWLGSTGRLDPILNEIFCMALREHSEYSNGPTVPARTPKARMTRTQPHANRHQAGHWGCLAPSGQLRAKLSSGETSPRSAVRSALR